MLAKATICCVLVSHQVLFPILMWAGSYYPIIALFIKEITSVKKSPTWHFLHCEVHKPVKRAEWYLPHTYHSQQNQVWSCTSTVC